jgi:hypothetical protein
MIRRETEMVDDSSSAAKNERITAAGRPPVRLFLRFPEAAAARPLRPSWLSRAFRLELYPGSLLLTARVAREMNLMAVILLVVTAFELGIWTALFHFLFEAKGAAILAACGFAVAVCYFERQLIVHDEVAKGRARAAMIVRLGYILLAALITSQAFELLIFAGPIRTRIHDEEVRREALAGLSSLAVLEGNLNDVTTAVQADVAGTASPLNALALRVQTKQERALLQAREDAAVKAASKLADLKVAADGAGRELRAVRSELRALRARPESDRDPGEEARLVAQSRFWQERWATLLAQRTVAQSVLEQTQGLTKTAGVELKDKQKVRDEELANRKDEVDKAKNRLVAWVGRLQEAKPGEKVSEPGGDWRFEEQSYDFLQKLRVLYDLLRGQRARWQGGTPAAIERLRHEFNLYEPQLCDGPVGVAQAPCDPEESARLRAERLAFRLVWLVGVLMALFIPLLVITVKRFLLPEELRWYYSRLHQAEAGQAEAMLLTRVDERLRRQAAGGKEAPGDRA